MSRWVGQLCCALFLWSTALHRAFAVQVYEWTGNDGWRQTEDNRLIIEDAGVFKFYATLGGPDDPLASIHRIFVEEGVNGPVEIHIVRDPNYGGGAGCVNLDSMDLLNASPGTLGECAVEGDFSVDDYVVVHGVVDKLTVGGDVGQQVYVLGDVEAQIDIAGDVNTFEILGDLLAPATFGPYVHLLAVLGTCTADVDCAGLLHHLSLGSLAPESTITVNGDVINITFDDLAGEVHIAGDIADVFANAYGLSGKLVIGGETLGDVWFQTYAGLTGTFETGSFSGTLAFEFPNASALTGTISIPGDCSGTIWLTDVSDATIDIGGVFSGQIKTEFPGAVVGGELRLGTIDGGDVRIGDPYQPEATVTASITIGEFNAGGVILWGELYDLNADASGGHIRVTGTFGIPQGIADIVIQYAFPGDTEYVTVDWKGDVIGTSWGAYGGVSINNVVYTGNTPSAHVWDITDCKGDMDNDGDVDYYDIDPLIDAFGDGTAYAAAFPGLAGSRMFHGDLDCSGTIDFYDIDPFIARL